MPKITEISEVIAAPPGCPFPAVVGVIQAVFPIGAKQRGTGQYGDWHAQNIVLRDRKPGSSATIKVTLWSQPELTKDSKSQEFLIEAGAKGGLATKETTYENKTEVILEVKKACATGFMRDGATPATQPPPQAPQRPASTPDHLEGDPHPAQAQNTPQQAPTAPARDFYKQPNAPGNITVTIPTPAEAIANVKEGMKRPALAILLCLEKVDEIEAARFRRLNERLAKLESGSEEAFYVNGLIKECHEPNPEQKLELLRSLLIQGGQSGLWDMLPLVSLERKPAVVEPPEPPAPPAAPVQAPAPTPAPAVAPAKAQKSQLPSHGQPGYNIDPGDIPF